MQNQEQFPSAFPQDFNLRDEIESYILHWKWFVIIGLTSLLIAYLYLRYTIPQYKAATTILVKDEKKGGMPSELATFSDLGMISGMSNNVDNEIEVIKSRSLIASSINALNLNVIYKTNGRVKQAELYKKSPVTVVFSKATTSFLEQKRSFRLLSKNKEQFLVYDSNDELLGSFAYNTAIPLAGGSEMKVTQNKSAPPNTSYDSSIEYIPLPDLVADYKSRLKVSPFGKNTSVVELSFIDAVPEKAEDFLNTLVTNYNSDAIADKKFISENTARFIENRLRLISEELKGVESDVERFKKTNKVTDLVSESGLFIENASEFEKREIETTTQLKVVASMISYVNAASNADLIPANILSSQEGAAALIAQYNQYILERNRVLKTAGSKNALVLNLENKIESLRTNIASELQSQQTALEIKRKDLMYQNNVLGGKIAQIPTQEKVFRDISRKQNIKEALYLYLLQKREETAISLSVTAPNAKIIDTAMASKTPVAPKRAIIYLGALLLGLFIPFVVIYISKLLDTKVKTRMDVESATSIPFIGEVPKSDLDEKMIRTNSRASVAEALRIVRTNIEFLLGEVKEGRAKTIFLTSTFPKEGKTFVSVNLAATIALSDKKVLLLGMDIRNPKLEEYLEVQPTGITSYLTDKETDSLDAYITKVPGFSHFDVLPAGLIPPNPAELLMNQKVQALFEKLKKEYDYIIVDTAPITLVTDTLLISKYADAFLYVVRCNVLDKRMLSFPEKLYQEKKLPNMAILINDTDLKKGYGNYGYSYGYTINPKKSNGMKKMIDKIFKK